MGNGSDEVLALVFLSLLNHTEPLLFPDISYSFYPVYCRLFGLSYATVPLNDAMEIDISGYRHANGGVIFPNPNAPTGRLLALSEIEEMVAANVDSVVVFAESYSAFGGGLDCGAFSTPVPLRSKTPN